MPIIAVTATGPTEAEPYAASIATRGGIVKTLFPKTFTSLQHELEGISGLLLCGGYDVQPQLYGEEAELGGVQETYAQRDEMEMALLRYAIEHDMPVLGICRGMQLINVVMGGKLIQDLPGHSTGHYPGPGEKPIVHPVYVSPGSRLGAIIGAGAIYRVNSLHHQGLKEPQRAPGLLASAYSPDDGIVEALESPEHPWLVGVQCHPERESEVPKSFLKLFDWLIGWAERYEAGDMPA